MIKLKLNELAKKLGKSITDIAEETGLNRNTVTALFHNKVDGIKFETIEKICDTYKVSIHDIFAASSKTDDTDEKTSNVFFDKPYKQEGEVVPFTCWTWMIQSNKNESGYFKHDLGQLACYFRANYGDIYWERDSFNRLAASVYDRYKDPKEFDMLFREFVKSSKGIEELYLTVDPRMIIDMNETELLAFYERLWKEYESFWRLSVFVDSFDAGYDKTTMDQITERCHLAPNEVVVLTTPQEKTFANDRLQRLLEIIKVMKKKGWNAKKPGLKEYVAVDADLQLYAKEFSYYRSNYVHTHQITIDEISEEVLKYLADEALFARECKHLDDYESDRRKAVAAVLKKHALTTNPLEFFQKLTFWREYRKKINLMGIHLQHDVVRSLEKKTGIAHKYLNYLSFDEIGNVLKGLVTLETLQRRYEKGMLVHVEGNRYKIVVGEEAASLRRQIEDRMRGNSDGTSIVGQVASQGYAKGIARIILSREDFDSFKEGEILVTGMTRPEFVPLMKRAAGIVTNEGGITCHAAIVSRELGKPCVIGTQIATQVIKTGDLVEVRANHGTVRILS